MNSINSGSESFEYANDVHFQRLMEGIAVHLKNIQGYTTYCRAIFHSMLSGKNAGCFHDEETDTWQDLFENEEDLDNKYVDIQYDDFHFAHLSIVYYSIISEILQNILKDSADFYDFLLHLKEENADRDLVKLFIYDQFLKSESITIPEDMYRIPESGLEKWRADNNYPYKIPTTRVAAQLDNPNFDKLFSEILDYIHQYLPHIGN